MIVYDFKFVCLVYKMLNKGGICEKCKNGNLIYVVLNCCFYDFLVVSFFVMFELFVYKLLGFYKCNLDCVVVFSYFFVNKLQEWGWDKEQLVYIFNYVDVGVFDLVYDFGEYLFYFGCLVFEKGLKILFVVNVKVGS